MPFVWNQPVNSSPLPEWLPRSSQQRSLHMVSRFGTKLPPFSESKPSTSFCKHTQTFPVIELVNLPSSYATVQLSYLSPQHARIWYWEGWIQFRFLILLSAQTPNVDLRKLSPGKSINHHMANHIRSREHIEDRKLLISCRKLTWVVQGRSHQMIIPEALPVT